MSPRSFPWKIPNKDSVSRLVSFSWTSQAILVTFELRNLKKITYQIESKHNPKREAQLCQFTFMCQVLGSAWWERCIFRYESCQIGSRIKQKIFLGFQCWSGYIIPIGDLLTDDFLKRFPLVGFSLFPKQESILVFKFHLRNPKIGNLTPVERPSLKFD